MLFVLLLIGLVSGCGSNPLSYELARLKAKQHYLNALGELVRQRLRKLQAAFDEQIDSELADTEEIRLRPVEARNDRPRCQQCRFLEQINPFTNCPILIKELQCQPFVIDYDGEECLMANVTCSQPFQPDRDLATYLGAVAYDLVNKKRALHILYYYNDDGLKDIDTLDMEDPHPGRGFKAHLTCNDYRRWTTFANDRKYDIDSLFCLTLHADQLENVRDLFPI